MRTKKSAITGDFSSTEERVSISNLFYLFFTNFGAKELFFLIPALFSSVFLVYLPLSAAAVLLNLGPLWLRVLLAGLAAGLYFVVTPLRTGLDRIIGFVIAHLDAWFC